MRYVLVCAVLYLVPLQAISASNTNIPSAVGVSERGPADDVAPAASPDDLAPAVFSRQELCEAVVAAAEAHDLPIGFLARLIWQESGFNTLAVSRAGAQGIAQFMPEVAAEMGLADPFDPTEALPASARFLRALHHQFGNHGLAAAAYNAGSGRVRNWLTKRTRLPQETRNYVYNITGRQPEQWIGTRQKFANFTIPPRTQCQQAAATVAAAQAARWSRHASKPRTMRVRAESVAPVDAAIYKQDVY